MAKPTHTQHTQGRTRADVEAFQRGIHCDAATEQRRHTRKIRVGRDGYEVVVIDHVVGGVTAVIHVPLAVFAIEAQRKTDFAIVLVASVTGVTASTAVGNAPYSDGVTD